MTSIFGDDQEKALDFYTTELGFVKKTEVPLGAAKWLTVAAPNDTGSPELVLDPDSHPAVGPLKNAPVQDGISFTWFAVEDVRAEYDQLTAASVTFTQPPRRWDRSSRLCWTIPAAI